MKDIREILIQLAEKLGTNIESLWAVLIKQQYIDAYCYFAWGAIFLCIVILGSVILPKHFAKLDGEKGYCEVFSQRQMAWRVFLFIVVILTIITIVVWTTGFRILCNPEYYALREILNCRHH